MDADRETIRRVLAGDTDAFGELVARYERPVRILARNLLADRHAAEDAAQEAFLAAFRNLAGFDPGRAGFLTWLLTIARNKCLNARKKRAPEPMKDLPDIADARTPAAAATEKELAERLDRALEALPDEQRTAFALAAFVGLSGAEIAAIEGVEAGTVRSRISRAKARLREELGICAGDER